MKIINLLSFTVPLALACAACQSPQDKVESERREGRKEVGAAATKVQETEMDAARNIAGAKTVEDGAAAKIDATEDLANAKEKLGDEKAEATQEIGKAEADAGMGGTYKKE